MQQASRGGLLSRLMSRFLGSRQNNAPLSGDYAAPGSWSDPAVMSRRGRPAFDESTQSYGTMQPLSAQMRDRISDDTTRSPGTFEETAPEDAQTLRSMVARQIRGANQIDGPSRMDQMQAQYDALAPQKPTLKQQLLRALAGGIQGGWKPSGISPQDWERDKLARSQQEQSGRQFEEGQRNQERARLGQEMEAERRMQEQEQIATDRMRLQEQMQAERERAAQEAQGRLFGQQNQLEATREKARQEAATQAQQASEERQNRMFAESEKRQGRQFAQQEKMADQRQQQQKVTADEQRRADLARNMSENLDQLEQIVRSRKDLFGPLAGRYTQLRQLTGTSDPDIARLRAIKEYLGMASVGAHAMRNAQHVGAAADAVMAGFNNSPEATLAAIQAARQSIATFQRDANEQPGSAPRRPAGGGAKLKDRMSGKVLVEGEDF